MPDDIRTRLKEWLASGAARLEPLTFPQREIWETSAVPVADPRNHICVFMEVKGAVTQEQCIAAVQLIVDRHEVMRLSFLPGRTDPLQLIRKQSQPAMEFSAIAPDESLEDRMREVFEAPFDLVRGPLYRIHILQRGENDRVLVMAIHHAIADGWTLGVFVQNLAEAYFHVARRLPGSLPPLPLSYSAWGAAERQAWTSKRLEDCAAYWRKQLANAPRLWDVAPDHSHRLIREVSSVPAELTTTARETARRCNATLFSTLLTAFQLAMAEWTGQRDIVVGTPFANRTKQAIRETMGYFSGVVPLRGSVDVEQSFDENLRKTHGMAVDSFAHAMPFAELVSALNEQPQDGRNPIFDVRFALQNHPIPDTGASGFSVQLRMRSTGTARFYLGCELTEADEGLELVWLYRPDLFSQTRIQELERGFLTALQRTASDITLLATS